MINEKEFNQDILDLLIKYGYNGGGITKLKDKVNTLYGIDLPLKKLCYVCPKCKQYHSFFHVLGNCLECGFSALVREDIYKVLILKE